MTNIKSIYDLYKKEAHILQHNLEVENSEASAVRLEKTIKTGVNGEKILIVKESRTLPDQIVTVTHNAHSRLIKDRQLKEYTALIAPLVDAANPVSLGAQMTSLRDKITDLNSDPASSIMTEEVVGEIGRFINASNESSKKLESLINQAQRDTNIWLHSANRLLQQLHELNARMSHGSIYDYDYRDKLLLELAHLMDFSRSYDDKGRVSIAKDGVQLVGIGALGAATLESSYHSLYSGADVLSAVRVKGPALSYVAAISFREGRLGAVTHFMNELLPQANKKLQGYQHQIANVFNRYHTSVSSYPAQTSFLGKNKLALNDIIYTNTKTKALLVQDNGMPIILDNLGNRGMLLDFNNKTVKEAIDELNQCFFTGLIQPVNQIGPIESIELIPVKIEGNNLTFNLKITNTLRSSAKLDFPSLNNLTEYVDPGATVLISNLTAQRKDKMQITIQVTDIEEKLQIAVIEYDLSGDINAALGDEMPISHIYDNGIERGGVSILPNKYATAELVDEYGQIIHKDDQQGYLAIKGQGIRIVLVDDEQQDIPGFLQQCGINQLIIKQQADNGRLDLALNPEIKSNPSKFAKSSLTAAVAAGNRIRDFFSLQLTGDVQVGDAITIGQKEFVFVANAQQGAAQGQIVIGADATATIKNIAETLGSDIEITENYSVHYNDNVLNIAINPLAVGAADPKVMWHLDEAAINGQPINTINLPEPTEYNSNIYRIYADQTLGLQSLLDNLQGKPQQELLLLNNLVTNAVQAIEDQEKISAAAVQTADQEWRAAAKIDPDIANQQLAQLAMAAKALLALWREKIEFERELQRLLMRS